MSSIKEREKSLPIARSRVLVAAPPTTWRRALVTGASSGIGEAFADELASLGVDLVVVGRDLTALETVAARARVLGVHVEVVRADLSDDHGVATVVASIRDAEPMIDLLVNNAGIGRAGAFADLSSVDLHATMRVNNDALVLLTHAGLLRMNDANRGCLIHVSSAASRGPVSGHALYVATKAFVTNFGQAISQELAATSITSTTVLVGYTRTKYFERNGMSPEIAESKWATAAQVAQQALEAAREHRSLVTTGPSHRWLRRLSTRYPGLADSFAGQKLRQLRGIVVSRRMRVAS